MRMVFVLFDSLVRGALGCYGGRAIRTPAFDRLAERAVAFDTHYVGSLPCMPARRDLHTGRLNFFHRSWGPLEPFDNSFPELLRAAGVYTHLVSDHCHYFEDGGWSYHQRYSSWEFVRGQETDRWKAMVQPPLERLREMYDSRHYDFEKDGRWLTHAINREFIREESEFPCVRCFQAAFEFLDVNRNADGWFLQIECFDPHEPFHAPARFHEAYSAGHQGPILDWPRYGRVLEDEAAKAQIKANYAALVAMCDEYFGRLLDYFDRFDMWKDTVLVLTTDHGFLLVEHDFWGKNIMPYYDEIAHIPFLIHHPDLASKGGERRRSLSQTPDVMPTILDLFGVEPPAEVRGRSLLPLLEGDRPQREAALFGMFGAATNVTDGRWTYFRYPPDLRRQELFEYTLMPTHIRSRFQPEELKGAELVGPFDFTKGVQLLRLPARDDAERPPGQDDQWFEDATTVLYDTEADPEQSRPIDDPEVVARLLRLIAAELASHDAPPEAFRRIGLPPEPADA
jgi:arylsulfatase A-like enzyme